MTAEPYHGGVAASPRQSHPASGSPRADLASLHVVVPVRTLAGGKARLGEAIDAEEREGLIAGMLRDELAVLGAWGLATAIHVVSPDPEVAPLAMAAGAQTVAQAERRPQRGDPRRARGRRYVPAPRPS